MGAPFSKVSASYMKMADVYMSKQNFKLAAKNFQKVLKRTPSHLPALLGLATALERVGTRNSVAESSLVYGNATRLAIALGDDRLAEAALRRAVDMAGAKGARDSLSALRKLAEVAHTFELAADLRYTVGAQILEQHEGDPFGRQNATREFQMANMYLCQVPEVEGRSCFHRKSTLELGKMALDDNSTDVALGHFNMALQGEIDEEKKVELLVLLGQAMQMQGDIEGAITSYEGALSLGESDVTSNAHHHLAVALSTLPSSDAEAAVHHFEQALNMGMDPTPEAISALGEDNVAVIRGLNRARWKEFQTARDHQATSRGGVMSGDSFASGSKSIFAKTEGSDEDAPEQSGTLSLLEQGAAAYDGHVPSGDEIEGEENRAGSIGTTTRSSKSIN